MLQELLAFGIVKKESSWVYPTGLVNTIIYTWLSFKYQLPGEGLVNFYYTAMSLYGWYNWSRKDLTQKPIIQISYSGKQEWIQQILFFIVIYIILYGSLTGLKEYFFEGAIPWADALASAAAFTGMWLMTQKKSGKLVLVDSYQHYFDAALFCERIKSYGALLFDTFAPRFCRTV